MSDKYNPGSLRPDESGDNRARPDTGASMTVTKHIDSEAVEVVFISCLFKVEEVPDGKPPDDAVIAEGIMHKVAFHRARLESNRQKVSDWLALLPKEFRKDGGGGWSFLNACVEVDGTQWTGLHQRMDQLFTLGIGLGLAKWQLPRAMWRILPGGMPYVEIATEAPASKPSSSPNSPQDGAQGQNAKS